VIVGDENGCVDTSAVYVVNNVGIHDLHPLAKAIHIYPNPGSEVLHIKAPVQVRVMLTTIEGKVIKSERYEGPIDIRELSAGLYLIKVYDLSGNAIMTEKFVKTP